VAERREVRNLKLAALTFISYVITFDAEANIVNRYIYIYIYMYIKIMSGSDS
jgi:hypothetical protein